MEWTQRLLNFRAYIPPNYESYKKSGTKLPYFVENTQATSLLNGTYEGVIIVQSIGRSDSTGTLIFEGDIVDIMPGAKEWLGYIRYSESELCFMINLINEKDEKTQEYAYAPCTIKGNVFQHPSLLEQK